MKKHFYLIALLVALFTTQVAVAQAPVATPEKAIEGLLTRIGGASAPSMFEIVIDASLAENGKDVFVITAQNGKPCIKGNTQLSVATGINWYLNHYAHINLTWNNLTTDLSAVTLPVPASEEKHVSSAKYRYDFNTCTFSYSMAFWTWERWQQEIDWMALHGINAPLNLVGLDVVTRNFLQELGVNESDIDAYIAGPGFIAWFAMNNLEGWGGTINSSSTGVQMNGNPDWWYTRQENLCRNMLQRMRELGMQPVIPGFSGQIPNSLSNYTITGFSSGDVINGGTWAGGYTRPDILHPNSSSYATLAPIYYKHLEAVMGVSEFYSMDPFHEGGLPGAVTNATCYPPIMAALDTYHNDVEDAKKTSYNVSTDDNQAKWIIQYWQNIPQSGAFSSMSSYGDRFIGLDLFSDNIYADNAAKWRGTGENCYYKDRPYIYCMLHNFGGRSGLHGRLETTMDGYFKALANNNNCQGIGATPEGIETNPILYDMLFELPWMSSNPGADAWLEEYAYSRYGVDSKTAPAALEALKNLKKSVWDCKVNQQGTSEAVILARPNWTIGSVSAWSTSAIYWDTQDVLLAADQLCSVKDVVTANGGADGIANYNYDFIDVVRQAMVDYAAQLLPLINAARGNDAEYTRLYQLYLQLMLDLDTMLSYDENFKLERWTSLARNIAKEVDGTTENDRNWLEWNARTQVTVWSKGNTDLHDYSNRCWAGLIKDFHYWRWKYFFENNGGAPSGGWYSGFEYPWTVDFNETYNYAGDYSQIVIPTDVTATVKAAQTFGNYFGRVKGATKNYIFPMGVATNATKSDVIPEVYRGKEVELPLIIGKQVTISSVWVDLNNDGNAGNGETLTANGNNVTIPADAAIGKTTAKVTYSDGTVITFNLALIEDITSARLVTAVAGANGSVAIEGTNELSITTTEAVKMTATANTGYNFENWTKGGEVVSNDNPYIYYGKEEATFTANFIQDRWGVPSMTAGGLNDAVTNNQYVSKIDFAYYNREAETIYDATSVAPTSLFTTIPQIIDVPQGASFTISWTDNGAQNLTKCFLSAYMDFNGNGNFEEEGELVKVVGTRNADNSAVRSGSFQVVLPYDAPTGITHLRMRFDSAWGNQYNSTTKAFNSKGELNRMCYEVVINITEKSDKAATINVETNSAEWGTVEVWTDETPDGSTGTEWVVSANIPMYLRATKASEDVEFLGWYDQYGRLLTENLEHTMYAREDATYTARFRKFLEIDGWQIEYRTQPVQKINLGSEKPVAGKKYYIYANAKNNSSPLYLYNDAGSLATATAVDAANEDAYIWEATASGDYLTFESVATAGQFIGYGNIGAGLTVNTTPVQLDINSTYASGQMSNCVGIMRIGNDNAGKYMVTKNDGSAFNRNSVATNGDWCSDYVFVEIPGDVVILTEVRKSGNHDLVIPETVTILGEQCKIVGFDNNLFKDNKDLWSISLPATIEEMSNNVLFSTSVKGENTPTASGDNNPDNKVQVIDLGFTLKNSEHWTIRATYKSDGVSTFNGWGSPLLYANGEGTGTELFYLSNTNQWSSCWHVRSPFSGLGNDYFKEHTNTKISTFIAAIENKGNGKAVITITNSEGESQTSSEVEFSYDNISAFSAKLPKGLDITNFEVLAGAEPDPFEGCTNLLDITIADGVCQGGYTVDGREFKNASGVVLHTLADKEKEEGLRALGELMDLTKALIAEVTTNVNPTGKATALALNATQGNDYYIWCNAPQSGDEGNVGNLLDGNGGTFFHSNWGNTTAPADGLDHHLTVELGSAHIEDFKFYYKARSGNGLGDYPKTIKVQGSNDGDNYNDIAIVEPRNGNGGVIENGAEWTSDVLGDGNSYTYLRFMVTATTTNKKTDGHIYWHMAEFDLLKLTSLAEVKTAYANLAGVTATEVEGVYDSMAEALFYYNNGGTAEQLTAAYNALEPLYDALNTKKDKVFNGVYHVKLGGQPLFVAYTETAVPNMSNDVAGYHLFDATTGNTSEANRELQNNAIAAKAQADALFTIVPNNDNTGYTISAQGLYLHSTRNGGWAPQLLSNDAAQAGVYLFEETTVDDVTVLKIKSNRNDIQYMNDWGAVIGNDKSNKANLSTFTLTQVAEYTLTVPANGVTTLCLPFNVVLPAGVTAYDLAEANLTNAGSYHTYKLVTIASEGETLAKNTPVIVKATAGDYVLTITMNDEDAKASTAGTLLRSALVKTTIEAGSKYIYDGKNFNRVTAATEIAANQCWMELGESKGDIIYGETPVVLLTTDEENPVLYNIYIKRTADVTVLQYDEASKQIAVRDKAANNSYQAWYFTKGSADGQVFVHPYNADGNVIGATNTGNGAGKVSAAGKDAQEYDEWVIVARDGTGGYYNINATNGAYFSNFGGTGSKMGFWDGDANESNTQNDGGSLFKFVPLTFDNDNPRFYQMKDLNALLPADKYIAGTSVGFYSEASVAAYTDSKATATTHETAGSASSSAADCYNAYKALRTTNAAVEYIAPDPAKVYYIVSASTKDYCAGKYLHTNNEPIERTSYWGTNTYTHEHLMFAAIDDITHKQLAAFQFEETGVVGEYKMKSLNSGLYVKSFAGTHMGAEGDAQAVKIAPYATGQLTLKVGNNDPMHAQNDYSVIVQWSAEENGASLWIINEVTDATAFNYTLTVPSSGIATLYLPFNVTLPKGVTAYTVDPAHILQKGDGTYYYDELTQVAAAGEKLAKGNAVIIKATAGEYTFKATFDDTGAKTATASALVGTYYQTTTSTGYSMAVENNEPIFNAITADTAVEPYNCWLVADGITTDKIGTSVEFQSVEIEDGKVYRIRGRLSNGVLRTLYNNGANKKILWTGEAKDDASTIFIAQEGEGGKFKLVSALANGYWSQDAKIEEEGVELTFANGSVNGTAMIVGNNGRRFCVDGNDLDFYSNVAVEPANAYVNENVTTDFVFELVEDVTVGYTLRMAKNNAYATLYLPYAVTVPSGVTAYIAHSPTTSLMMLTDVKGVIPANTPVVIKRETTNVSEDYLFAYTTDAPAIDFASYTNRLKGYLIDTLVEGETGYNYYMLMRYNTVEAFYWILKEYDENGKLYTGLNQSTQKTHIKCTGNKAFFSTSTPNNSASYRFVFEGTTGIDGVEAEGSEVDAIYDLQGRKLEAAPEKGVYIVNGELIVK